MPELILEHPAVMLLMSQYMQSAFDSWQLAARSETHCDVPLSELQESLEREQDAFMRLAQAVQFHALLIAA